MYVRIYINLNLYKSTYVPIILPENSKQKHVVGEMQNCEKILLSEPPNFDVARERLLQGLLGEKTVKTVLHKIFTISDRHNIKLHLLHVVTRNRKPFQIESLSHPSGNSGVDAPCLDESHKHVMLHT